MGGLNQVTDDAVTKYYSIAGITVAMDDSSGMKYLLTDHLGSVVAITDASGSVLSQQRYLPFGQVRTDVGSVTQTDFGFTGQRNIADIGLIDYHARMYDAAIGKFIQPDTIIPDQGNPQTWNRYAYVYNDPIDLTDPTGNFGKRRDGMSGYRYKMLKKKVGALENQWMKDADAKAAAEAQAAYYAAARTDDATRQAASNSPITLNSLIGGGNGQSDLGLYLGGTYNIGYQVPSIPLDPTQNPQTPPSPDSYCNSVEALIGAGFAVGVDLLWGIGLVGTGIAGALLGNVAGAGAAMTTYMELTEWIPLAALVVGAVIVVHSNCIGDWKNKFGTNK